MGILSGLTEPLGRLKWGFLPVRRIVDEDDEPGTDEDWTKEHEDVIGLQESNFENEEQSLTGAAAPELLEYRDEAGRPWWKWFDEYEYRQNKYARKAHKFYKWFDDGDSPAQRKLMWKLDILLTFYSFMAYWVKYLDQTNLNNAYVAPHFAEDLGMKGNDLVNTQVMFSIGNIVFQIPFMYVLYALPLNYVLPALDLCWSVLTICVSQIHSTGQLKAMRFFIGAFEAPAYMAYQYLFGTFISNPAMIARRSMFYYFGQYLGILTSGVLSASIIDHMEGVAGYHAWQWIFIIDGLISAAIGLLGVYMIPGTPTDCYSIWLSDDEIRLLRKGLKANHVAGRPDSKQALKNLFSPKIWREILTSWEIYVLSVWNLFCWNNSNGGSGAYILWLKSLKRYNPGELQNYTALTPGLGFVWLLVTSMFADLFHCRWGAILGSQVFNITGNVILAVWHVGEGAKWFAWILQYFGWAMAPTLYAWQSDICRRDAQKRAVILVWMNMLAQASTAWMSVIVWKTVEAPRYLKGYSWTAACAFALCVWTMVVLQFYKWNEKRFARQNGIVLYNSATGPVPPEVEAGSVHSAAGTAEKVAASAVHSVPSASDPEPEPEPGFEPEKNALPVQRSVSIKHGSESQRNA